MRGHVTLPNLITTANLVSGFLALLVVRTDLLLATGLVVLAALFDWLDGVAARRRSGDSAFGANLDSLADLLSFGVVPAMALAGTLERPGLGVGVAGCFLVAGAWRLARFPLVKTTSCFVGLPIPLAGVLAMVVVSAPLPGAVVAVAAVALSGLMVSTLPFPTIASAGRGATRVTRPVLRRRRRRHAGSRVNGLSRRQRLVGRSRPRRLPARWPRR